MITIENINLICWLIFLGYWLINWKSVKPAIEIAWQAPNFRWTGLFIIIVIVLFLHFAFPKHSLNFLTQTHSASSIMQIIGICLTIIGLIIAIVARKTLADNWSSDIELKKNHKLITTGVYQYTRHPIYTGIDLMCLGSVLSLQSILVVIFFLWVAGFMFFKMKKEETLLMKHFPKDYAEYKKKTKTLIPFIY
jgi:protein-S-isoprenylcysteine O-methyltransferase Ste14